MVIVMRWVLLGTVATAVIPWQAHAQPVPAADKAKTDTAREYVNAGLAAQNAGDYDTAISLFEKAHALVPHPVLLFNMAQANRLAGRIEKALALYARYLAEAPKGAQAKDARALVAEIEAKKAEDARKLEEARTAELARKAEQARKAEEARKLQAARDAEAQREREREAAISSQAQRPPPIEQRPGRNQRIAGVAMGAVGVGALLVGAGFGFHADSLASELSKPGAMYDTDKVDAGEQANTVAILGLVGGAALVATGAALYWWGYREGSGKEVVTIAPMMADHMAGLVVSGSM
jgi:tetratricopeptide (TPR) repeat protein